MSTTSPSASFPDIDIDALAPRPVTLVELADRFGDIPATRICLSPPPGQATEEDLIYFDEHEDRLFELVDGTLIEKTMGNKESRIAGMIFGALYVYLRANPIGVAMPGDGQLKIRSDAIRVPDVSYLTNERSRQSGFAKRQKIAAVAPNLAVEVISQSNSRKEMDEKLKDYFSTGSEEVWYVYPKTRELHQFTGPQAPRVWQGEATITTPLLPGFEMKLAEIFELPPDADS